MAATLGTRHRVWLFRADASPKCPGTLDLSSPRDLAMGRQRSLQPTHNLSSILSCSSLLHGIQSHLQVIHSVSLPCSQGDILRPKAHFSLCIQRPMSANTCLCPMASCACPLPPLRPLGFCSHPGFCLEKPFQSLRVKPHRFTSHSPPPLGSRSNVITSKKPPATPHP